MKLYKENFQQINSSQLEYLLGEYPFKPYQQFNMASESFVTGYHKNRILQMLEDRESTWAIVNQGKNRLNGLAILRRQPWETSYFGVNIGEVSYLLASYTPQKAYETKKKLFKSILKLASKIGFRLICFEVDARDLSSIHAAQGSGFQLMINQQMVGMDKSSLSKRYRLDKSWTIRPFQKSDLSQMVQIAKKSKIISRYHNDYLLPAQKRKRYYETKVKNCCFGGLADESFILEKDSRIFGFYFYQIQRRLEGLTIIFGVDVALSPDVLGRGLGTMFVRETVGKMLKKGDIVIGKTHIGNLPMIRALNKIGCKYFNTIYTFHRWL